MTMTPEWEQFLKGLSLEGLLDILKHAKEYSDLDMIEADFIIEEILKRFYENKS